MLGTLIAEYQIQLGKTPRIPLPPPPPLNTRRQAPFPAARGHPFWDAPRRLSHPPDNPVKRSPRAMNMVS